MTRPHFVPDTPSAIHAVHGGSLTLTDDERRTPHDIRHETDLYTDSHLTIIRYKRQIVGLPEPHEDFLKFQIADDQNHLWLTAVDNVLHLYLGQVLYQITPSSLTQKMLLVTGASADFIYIDDNVKHPVQIDAGAGDDYLRVGGSYSTILSREGSDTIHITSGESDIESGPGDDNVRITSVGPARVYLGEGEDIARAGPGLTFIDAGPGDDVIVGGIGEGHNVLCGGDGNDTLQAGSSTNVIYPGKGQNRVTQLKPIDKVYGQPGDTLVPITAQERLKWLIEKLSTQSPALAEQVVAVLFPDDFAAVNHVVVAPSDAGKTGVIIEGSPDFVARVEADLNLLRLSPHGQKMLQALDNAAQAGGRAVYVRFSDQERATFEAGYSRDSYFIRDGQPGVPAYGGLIQYNPFLSPQVLSPQSFPPIVVLYHELCHAYNAVTGTAVAGATAETLGSTTEDVRNTERQAVGLPIAMDPFDFDLDPETPPTSTNPEAYTENGFRKELGLPPRTSYSPTPTNR